MKIETQLSLPLLLLVIGWRISKAIALTALILLCLSLPWLIILAVA